MIVPLRLVRLMALLVLGACAQNAAVPAAMPVTETAPNQARPIPDQSDGGVQNAAEPTAMTATQADQTAQAPDQPDSYVIGSGDQLQVFVYDSPQLSVEVPVRPDGRISTPLVPELMAAGKTPSQLGVDLTARLKKYLNDPNVTVIVRNFVGPFSRQIRVIGEAVQPQAIPYRDHMSVLDVMIMTKGLTRYAAGNRAVIVRRTDGRQENLRVRLSDLLKNGDIDQNVEMQPGDTLIIPQSWF